MTDVRASTMHAYVLKLLNELGDASGKRIADEWETTTLVSQDVQRIARLRGARVDLRAVKKFLRRLGAGFRSTQVDEASLTSEERQLRDAFMQARGFLVLRTFDELAQDCIQLLESGHRLVHPPKALVIDEYQDLTAGELRLIRLISEQSGAGVFACGDDRQSIYGFRQADPLSLNNFGMVYGVDPTYMSISHRCPRAVVDLSEAVAARMPVAPGLSDRPKLEPEPERADPGRVRVISFAAMWPEVDWVSRTIDELRRDRPTESVMVIAPYGIDEYVKWLNLVSEDSARVVRFVDSRMKLPFQTEDAFRLWLALLRLAADEKDQLAWRAILEIAHGYGDTTVTSLYAAGASNLRSAIRARAPLDQKVRRLEGEVTGFIAQLREAADEAGVIAVLGQAASQWRAMVPSSLWADIQASPLDEELPEPSPEDISWKRVLIRCLHAASANISDSSRKANEVLVYTVFQAKGQEADHVFVCGTHSDAFRDQDVGRDDGLRRLYVAITRPLKTLTLTLARDVRGTPLHSQITGAPTFPAEILEACEEVGIEIESDPG